MQKKKTLNISRPVVHKFQSFKVLSFSHKNSLPRITAGSTGKEHSIFDLEILGTTSKPAVPKSNIPCGVSGNYGIFDIKCSKSHLELYIW